jgi:hypothetical protein
VSTAWEFNESDLSVQEWRGLMVDCAPVQRKFPPTSFSYPKGESSWGLFFVTDNKGVNTLETKRIRGNKGIPKLFRTDPLTDELVGICMDNLKQKVGIDPTFTVLCRRALRHYCGHIGKLDMDNAYAEKLSLLLASQGEEEGDWNND